MDGRLAVRHGPFYLPQWSSFAVFSTSILKFATGGRRSIKTFLQATIRRASNFTVKTAGAESILWDCYRAVNKASFSQRIRRLLEWCENNAAPDVFIKPIEKLRKNIAVYMVAYDHPEAHRTSNMLDRLMQRMDRHLFSAQYFHGTLSAAQLSIRGWALIQNFAPSNPRTVSKHNGLQSPAERLNSFRYHDNWLHNLMISASLGGYKGSPQNPI